MCYFLGIYEKFNNVANVILVKNLLIQVANIIHIFFCIAELREKFYNENYRAELIESLENTKRHIFYGFIIFILWLLIPEKETLMFLLK